jgi:hypothetical protein
VLVMKECYLVGCNAILSGRILLMLCRAILPTSLGPSKPDKLQERSRYIVCSLLLIG